MRSFSSGLAGAVSAALAVVLAAGSLLQPASAANTGLYGTQDPSYDGVFRQSLTIIALRSHDVAVPAAAQSWLVSQQCADGSFMAYRAAGAACKEADLESYSGKDTNSTAIAAVALSALGKKARAAKAVEWLRAAQAADGGLPWLKGLESDASSTALAMLAVRTTGATPFIRGKKTLVSYLRSTMLGCGASEIQRGALAFQKSSSLIASDMTTAQAAAALSATFPITTQPRSSSNVALACPGGTPTTNAGLKDVMAGYLAHRLSDNKYSIPSAWGSGTDWSSTSWSVLALLGARRGLNEATAAVKQLRTHAAEAVGGESIEPGKAALLLLVIRAVDANPRNFGGINVLKQLRGALQ